MGFQPSRERERGGCRGRLGNKHQGLLFEDHKVYPTKSDIIFCRPKGDVIGLG